MAVTSQLNLNGNLLSELTKIDNQAKALIRDMRRLSDMKVNIDVAARGLSTVPVTAARTTTAPAIVPVRRAPVISSGLPFDTSIPPVMRAPSSFVSSRAADRLRDVNAELATARRNTSELANELDKNNGHLTRMTERLSVVAAGFFAIKSAMDVLRMTDMMTSLMGRMQFIVPLGQQIADYNQQIMDMSNRTRQNYAETANFITKVGVNAGRAFKDQNELLSFTEQLNKMLVIAGASASEVSSTLTQLPQALASGNLQGDELHAIRENAPLIGQAIENYAHQVLGLTGSLKDMGAQGQITARTIIDAMEWAADNTNAAFENMPFTWGQRINIMMNSFTTKMSDVFGTIRGIANLPGVTQTMDTIAQAMADIAYAGAIAAGAVANFMVYLNGLGLLKPLIEGIAVAFAGILVYLAAMQVTGPLALIMGLGVAFVYLRDALDGVSDYFNGFEGALSRLLPVIASITAMVAAWAVMHYSAAAAVAIHNAVLFVYEAICRAVAAAQFFVGTTALFMNAAMFLVIMAVGAVVWAFFNWLQASNLLGKSLQEIFSEIARVVADACNLMIDKINVVIDAFNRVKSSSNGFLHTNFQMTEHMDRVDVGSWMQTAGGWGKGIDDFAQNIRNAMNVPTVKPELGVGQESGLYDNMPDNVGKIKNDTGKIKKALDDSNASLQVLRELNEQRAINQFTLLDLSIPIDASGAIADGNGIDGIQRQVMRTLTEVLRDAATSGREGL